MVLEVKCGVALAEGSSAESLPPRVVRAGLPGTEQEETYVIFQFLVPVLMTYTVPFLYINVIGQLANPVKKNVWGGLNFFGNFILSTYLLLKILKFFLSFLVKTGSLYEHFPKMMRWPKTVILNAFDINIYYI